MQNHLFQIECHSIWVVKVVLVEFDLRGTNTVHNLGGLQKQFEQIEGFKAVGEIGEASMDVQCMLFQLTTPFTVC